MMHLMYHNVQKKKIIVFTVPRKKKIYMKVPKKKLLSLTTNSASGAKHYNTINNTSDF